MFLLFYLQSYLRHAAVFPPNGYDSGTRASCEACVDDMSGSTREGNHLSRTHDLPKSGCSGILDMSRLSGKQVSCPMVPNLNPIQ